MKTDLHGRRTRESSKRRWSVRTYLGLIVLAAVVAVGVASAYGFLWSRGEARDDATRDMTLQARRAASSISSAVAAVDRTVVGLAAQPGLSQVLTKPEGCTLSVEGSSPFPSVRLDIVAPDGRVACSSKPSAELAAGRMHGGSAWLRDVAGDKAPSVHWDAADAAVHKPAVAVAAPIMEAGASAGTVVAFMHLPESGPALARDVAGFGEGSFTLVNTATHRTLSTSEASQDPGRRFDDSKRIGTWAGLDGSQRIFGSAAVPASGDWRVYAGTAEASALASARGALVRNLVVGLLALLLLGAAVWILNRRVAGPLRAVKRAAKVAARDPDGMRVAEAGCAELVALTREFNTMLDVRAGHEAQLVHQATHDPLTGLPNQALLYEQIEEALDRDELRRGVALLFVGLDHLGLVNAGFGHGAGNRVLVELSVRLSAALRPGDTLARFGGENFVVLCPDCDAEQAGDVADRLQSCVALPFRGPDSDILLHVAIGIAVADERATSSARLLREAHTAMREAVRTGRSFHHFSEQLQVDATEHLTIEHDLWRALEQEEFVVYYQPLHELETGRIIGTEALVRWAHPERGLVPPMDFIPIAEATGQINAIGRFVLVEACTQAARWADAGHPLRMSVNVSVDELQREDFPDTVRDVLSSTGLAADHLCLEITESSLIGASARSSSSLAALKAMGVTLAIDDFGTGYSSLSYLHELPVDELKVDRSFIRRLDSDGRDRHLVEAIVVMAHALGLKVAAEGVENSQQLEILRELDCELAQGYLFGAAQPADSVALRWRVQDPAFAISG